MIIINMSEISTHLIIQILNFSFQSIININDFKSGSSTYISCLYDVIEINE